MKKYLIGFAFLLIPLILPLIFKTIYPLLSPYKEIGSIDGWLGFLGGYTGGFIALVGIWWQLKESKKNEERNKKSGLIEYLLHRINRNTENEELSKISYDIQNLVSYTSFSNKKNYKPLYEFEDNFFNDNIKTIMELNNDNKNLGSNILDLRETINEFNRSVQFLSENSYIKCKLLEEFKFFIEKTINKKNLPEIKIITDLSTIIFKYNHYLDKLMEEKKITNGSKPHQKYIAMAKNNIMNNIEKCDYFDNDIKSRLKIISNKVFMEENPEILSKELNDLLITTIDRLNEQLYNDLLLSDSLHKETYIKIFSRFKEFNSQEDNINGKIFSILESMNKLKTDLENIKL